MALMDPVDALKFVFYAEDETVEGKTVVGVRDFQIAMALLENRQEVLSQEVPFVRPVCDVWP